MTENTSTPKPIEDTDTDDADDTAGHVFIDTFIDPRQRDKLSARHEVRANDEQTEA